jgi:hypothetical protein
MNLIIKVQSCFIQSLKMKNKSITRNRKSKMMITFRRSLDRQFLILMSSTNQKLLIMSSITKNYKRLNKHKKVLLKHLIKDTYFRLNCHAEDIPNRTHPKQLIKLLRLKSRQFRKKLIASN